VEPRLAQSGAIFVGLASLPDPSLVVPEVLRSLGLREAEDRTPSETLQYHLRERRLLLVLDNLEHLLAAAVEVAELLESCPDLVVLATSRAPLRVWGEQEYPCSRNDLGADSFNRLTPSTHSRE
jgi:predicted ATPase